MRAAARSQNDCYPSIHLLPSICTSVSPTLRISHIPVPIPAFFDCRSSLHYPRFICQHELVCSLPIHPPTTSKHPSNSLINSLSQPFAMASRSLPKLVQSSARRLPSLAVPQQRALSSLRQASAARTAASAQASSSSVRKTAVQAAGSVAARRYAHTGEKSEYMVSFCIMLLCWWPLKEDAGGYR